jgi:HEPN domain-containing protein
MDTPIGFGKPMKNTDLIGDYLVRVGCRLKSIELLLNLKSYADVVRQSQEAIELSLKALLRFSKVEIPRIHDVSGVLKKSKFSLPKSIHPHVEQLAKISKNLRRDRELSFYGSEDLTPGDFYEASDAKAALENANWVYQICKKTMQEK